VVLKPISNVFYRILLFAVRFLLSSSTVLATEECILDSQLLLYRILNMKIPKQSATVFNTALLTKVNNAFMFEGFLDENDDCNLPYSYRVCG
jgi:hypothetical protein